MIATSTIIVALAVAAAATSAYGAVSSANAQKDAANYNAAVEKNAAATAYQQGQFDAQQIRDKNRRLVASQRAAYGASGVDPNSGSPLDVQSDSALQGELEALTAIYTGKSGATAHLAQSRLDTMRANAANTAGWVGVGSSLLAGGSTIARTSNTNPGF